MFTKDAWNALLKTIEEPPEHVVFILATTELEKVPETIISRCQTFIFKKPTDTILAQVVSSVAKKEGYSIEEGGSELIALIADGAFRDALGTLQKIVSFTNGKKIKLSDVEEVTGAPNTTLVNNFLLSVAKKDIEGGYKVIEQANDQNIDMDLFIKMILAKLRFALMFRYAPNTKKDLENKISQADFEFISNLILDKPEHISSTTLSILLEAYQSLKNSVISSLPLELALVRILNPDEK